MGLKSVSVSSNERKTKAKHALDQKQRTGKKPVQVTGLPVPKTSLQISACSSRFKSSPHTSETSQIQVCIRLFYNLPKVETPKQKLTRWFADPSKFDACRTFWRSWSAEVNMPPSQNFWNVSQA